MYGATKSYMHILEPCLLHLLREIMEENVEPIFMQGNAQVQPAN